MEVGSARYGARSLPNWASLLAEVEPTRIGTKGGKLAGSGNALREVSRVELVERENRPREHLVYVRKVHFQAMFFFIGRLGHFVKEARLFQLRDCIEIEL